MWFVDDKEKSITRILISGMTILAICLIACMLHVVDVNTVFQRETQDNFAFQISNSTQALSLELEDLMKNTSAAAGRISKPIAISTDEEIFNTLLRFQDDYDEMVYISGTGKIYRAEGNQIWKADERELEILGNVKKERVLLKELEENGIRKNCVVFAVPVTLSIQITGHVVAYKDVREILNSQTYDYLQDQGYAFVTDKNGLIMASTPGAQTLIKKQKNLYNALVDYAYSSADIRLQIRNFQDSMKKNSSGFQEIASKNGEVMFVSYRLLEGTDGIYFVCCYNENLIQQRIQPVIFRSALTCMLIIILMIIAILYVWASSKKASTTFEKMAYEDEITGGKNLNYFKERATETILFHKEMPFLIQRFDIVNFRYINEAYGHNRADQILKGCIEMADQCFTEREICVRMDADQFLALLQNDGRSEQRREEYVRRLNEYARSIGVKYPIRLKFGIYQIRKNDTEIDLLIDRANAARKSLNGDEKLLVASYSEAIIREMHKVDKIESEMQKALDTREFKIYLQPKWDIIENKIVGVEALSRWIKPDKSMIMPNDFIPIFEKNGFIEKLDFYMLESLCKVIHEMLDAGIPVVPVSVNQSRVLLTSPDYTKNVAKVFERYQIPKEYIELELTETVFMEERDTMIRIMKELKAMNIKISMDDFGSGYSSLNMLKDVPFDVLKIDREFFSESFASEGSRWILQKVIEMAHGLGMTVICEGVETEEQIALLREIGCRYVQGYFYSQPISLQEYNHTYHGVDYELSE